MNHQSDCPSPWAEKVARMYFKGFSLEEIALRTTTSQERVWQAVCAVAEANRRATDEHR